jgi:RHS repeat-associated protein
MEIQDELGLNLLDYGARQYDAALGRFTTIDMATEIMKQYSPYVYSFNSPVMFQDMDGNFPTLAVGTDPTDPPKGLMKGKKVDMTGAPKSSALTAKGFPRNSRWFWKRMLTENPKMFSSTNTQLIKAGVAPVVDPKWVEFNPSHSGYKGKLIHHHVDQGRFAVGIPDQAHKKYFSKIHSRFGAKAKGFFRSTMKYANSFAGLLLAVDIFSSNPHSIGMMFEGGIGVKNNKLYHDRESGNYYEVTSKKYNRDSSGNIESADVTIDVYSDYQYNNETKKYEGAGEKTTTTSRVYYGEQARIYFHKLIKS